MTQRLPASVVVSFALHAGFLALFLGVVHEAPHEAQKIVEGVDLLIAPKPKDPGDGAPKRKPAPISTMDFLKMALPSAPRRTSLAAVDVKTETRRPKLAEAPKLSDATRRDLGPKLEALDLSRSRGADAAKLDVSPAARRQAAQTLAALPKLEDVGRRRVKNLPEALALEDRRREVESLAGVGGSLGGAPAPSRRQALAAVATLSEAAPSAASGTGRKSGLDILPERIDLGGGGGTGSGGRPMRIQPVAEAPKLERRQAAAATVQRKNLEIEGPLADRKIVSYSVPTFPEWAKQQGILEAEVAIRFNVDAEGNVLSDMRVQTTSGYGRLDRLAMDSLKTWKFAPAPGTSAQWGIITFRFLLE